MENNNTQRKILFVLPSLDAGGAERVLITLMNGVDRDHYDAEFISVRGKGPLIDLINPSIPVHSLNKSPVPYVFPFLPSLYRQIKAVQPDMIVSTMAHMNFAVLMLKPFFPDVRFVVREAITPTFLFEKYRKMNWIIKVLYKRLYPKADCIVSPSQKVFDEFRDHLGVDWPNRLLLKNPVAVTTIRNLISFSDQDVVVQEAVRFVACGRLSKQKGFDRLIRALGRFNPPYAWYLNILGEGPERPVLEDLIKSHGLEDRVFLKGLVMPPYTEMARADCLLMPSRFEGLPNVVLESLACGTPVIATCESGGIDEIAADCEEGVVRIVDTMQGFLHEMEKVIPCNNKNCAISFLAECYELENVTGEFDRLLNSLQ